MNSVINIFVGFAIVAVLVTLIMSIYTYRNHELLKKKLSAELQSAKLNVELINGENWDIEKKVLVEKLASLGYLDEEGAKEAVDVLIGEIAETSSGRVKITQRCTI